MIWTFSQLKFLAPREKGRKKKVMSKKEVAKVFSEEKVQKLIDQFNTNVNSAVKNVTKNCVLLANATDGDFTEAKNRLVESNGLSAGAISQMRGAGILYKEIKSINDVSYTKVYELARFEKAFSKLPIEKRVDAYTSLIGYVVSAIEEDLPSDYNDERECILRSGISNKELKIAVDCALEDAGLKKVKAIEKDTAEDTAEGDTSVDEKSGESIASLCYDSFIELSDAGKIEFLANLKRDGYITGIHKNWK